MTFSEKKENSQRDLKVKDPLSVCSHDYTYEETGTGGGIDKENRCMKPILVSKLAKYIIQAWDFIPDARKIWIFFF